MIEEVGTGWGHGPPQILEIYIFAVFFFFFFNYGPPHLKKFFFGSSHESSWLCPWG